MSIRIVLVKEGTRVPEAKTDSRKKEKMEQKNKSDMQKRLSQVGVHLGRKNRSCRQSGRHEGNIPGGESAKWIEARRLRYEANDASG